MIRRSAFLVIILILYFLANAHAAIIPDPELPNLAKEKILIAYFSYSGNTEKLARQIHNLTGGTLFRITGAEPYGVLSYQELRERALKELEENARPKIDDQVYNMASYDIVFIGYPIWKGTLPMIINTFLESYNFSGKIIVPFVTHHYQDTAFAQSLEPITKGTPHSIIFQGISAVEGFTDRAYVLKHLKRIDKEVKAVSDKKKKQEK